MRPNMRPALLEVNANRVANRKLSYNTRLFIINLRDKGYSIRKIKDQIGVPKLIVTDVIKRWNLIGEVN